MHRGANWEIPGSALVRIIERWVLQVYVRARARACVKRNAVFGARFKGLSLYCLFQQGNLIRIKTGWIHIWYVSKPVPPCHGTPLMISKSWKCSRGCSGEVERSAGCCRGCSETPGCSSKCAPASVLYLFMLPQRNYPWEHLRQHPRVPPKHPPERPDIPERLREHLSQRLTF